jgi:beta-galactosidase
VLQPGWHHIAGVYNGRTIKLFIDGLLVGERSGSGAIQTNDVDVAIGRIQDGVGRFQGVIDQVRISALARDDDWIKTSYRNLISPSSFIRVGEEEAV